MRLQALIVLLVSLFGVELAKAQSDELTIQGQAGKFYVQHTVVAKENWYSVGRLYNVSPKAIAPFNNTTMAQPLTIGQQLQIPLTATNFSQNGQKAATETLVPLYHVVQEKEWMYRVSVNYNKVPIATLEKWNHINKDQVKAGMHLIVGYLKVNTAQSAFATGGVKTAVAAATSAAGTPAATPVAGTPAASTPAAASSSFSKEDTSVTRERPVLAAPVTPKTETKTAAPAPSNAAPAAATPSAAVSTTSAPTATINFNGGYFKSDYTESGKSSSGAAGIFKSTSGWQDGKYYALMNNVPVGTIVKVTAGSKSIYAKILGQLPEMKESAGLAVRVSNAAASELGQGDGHFNVEVRY